MGLRQARELWVQVMLLQVYWLKVQLVLLHIRLLYCEVSMLGGVQAF